MKKINKIYNQVDLDDLVYRLKDGRKRDFSFIDNAKKSCSQNKCG